MRIRVISQTYTDLWRNREMLNPFKSGFYAIELLSHKVLRYAVPIFLVTALISSAVLAYSNWIFEVFFLLQAVFYFVALLGWILERTVGKIGIFAIPHYFVLANLASVLGFYKFLRGENYASWETVRET